MDEPSTVALHCPRCGDPLRPGNNRLSHEGSYCSLCQIELAGQKITEDMERPERERSRKEKIWFAIQVAILLAFFSFIALELH